ALGHAGPSGRRRDLPVVAEEIAMLDVIGGWSVVLVGIERILEAKLSVLIDAVAEERADVVLRRRVGVVGLHAESVPGLHAQLGAETVIARETFVATAVQAGDAALVQARVVGSHAGDDPRRAGGQSAGRSQDAAADRVQVIQRV